MAEKSFTSYRIRSTDPDELTLELNRVLSLVADRLDKLEGLRGQPKFFDKVLCNDDIIVLDGLRGVVLVNRADPPQYYRLTISESGTLTVTRLGASY